MKEAAIARPSRQPHTAPPKLSPLLLPDSSPLLSEATRRTADWRRRPSSRACRRRETGRQQVPESAGTVEGGNLGGGKKEETDTLNTPDPPCPAEEEDERERQETEGRNVCKKFLLSNCKRLRAASGSGPAHVPRPKKFEKPFAGLAGSYYATC